MAEPEIHTMRKDIERLKKKLSSPVLTHAESVVKKGQLASLTEQRGDKSVLPKEKPLPDKKKPGAPLPSEPV